MWTPFRYDEPESCLKNVCLWNIKCKVVYWNGKIELYVDEKSNSYRRVGLKTRDRKIDQH